ncbi:hypothetical protein JNJ66_06600 [Candidatus Saccharibacteria bacterium]|nr:hypothetical protein [Candidatus Saccharibacteria bacterium]
MRLLRTVTALLLALCFGMAGAIPAGAESPLTYCLRGEQLSMVPFGQSLVHASGFTIETFRSERPMRPHPGHEPVYTHQAAVSVTAQSARVTAMTFATGEVWPQADRMIDKVDARPGASLRHTVLSPRQYVAVAVCYLE